MSAKLPSLTIATRMTVDGDMGGIDGSAGAFMAQAAQGRAGAFSVAWPCRPSMLTGPAPKARTYTMPPVIETFFMKLIIWICFWSSGAFQKSCIMKLTGTRNNKSARRPQRVKARQDQHAADQLERDGNAQ